MGIYDRDYMRSTGARVGFPPVGRPANRRVRNLLRRVLAFTGSTVAISALGWLVSGGRDGGSTWQSVEGIRWLPVAMVAMMASLLLGAGEPGGLRFALTLLLGALAAFAYYVWIMGRLGVRVPALMLRHDPRGEGPTGIPVFELLVHATPWWLLLATTIGGLAVCAKAGAREGAGILGLATLLLSVPYLGAKLFTEVLGLDLFG